jgi:hypothetical protein
VFLNKITVDDKIMNFYKIKRIKELKSIELNEEDQKYEKIIILYLKFVKILQFLVKNTNFHFVETKNHEIIDKINNKITKFLDKDIIDIIETINDIGKDIKILLDDFINRDIPDFGIKNIKIKNEMIIKLFNKIHDYISDYNYNFDDNILNYVDDSLKKILKKDLFDYSKNIPFIEKNYFENFIKDKPYLENLLLYLRNNFKDFIFSILHDDQRKIVIEKNEIFNKDDFIKILKEKKLFNESEYKFDIEYNEKSMLQHDYNPGSILFTEFANKNSNGYTKLRATLGFF